MMLIKNSDLTVVSFVLCSCGDMYHIDLSLWSYEKLANVRWGVIALEWRDVDCAYKPAKRARVPWGTQKSGPERSRPWGWNINADRRPKKWMNWDNVNSGRKLL